MSIRLYRCIRSERETLITFQGDQEDVDTIGHFLPFDIPLSKQPYEKGYYFYLRGEQRDQLEESVKTYLQDNYIPPEIKPFLFPGNSALPSDRPHEEWNRAIEWRIRHFFKDKQYVCEDGGLGHSIYRQKPERISDVVTAYEGITYRITVDENYVPVLQVDLAYMYQCDGKTISQQKALRQLQNDDAGGLRLASFKTRDTEEILQVVQAFLDSLPPLVEGP